MDLREKIARNPAIATGTGLVMLLVAASFLFQEVVNKGPGRLKALYTDDDGKTWFKDDLRNLPPFDYGGKQAFRVQVFRCGGGPPFVGWMEAYSDTDKKNLEGMKGDDLAFAAAMSTYQPRVKQPGDAKWVTTRNRSQYDAITNPHCPGGSHGTPQPIGLDE